MKRLWYFFAVMLLMMSATGCSNHSSYMNIVQNPQLEALPEGKASVTFFRYSSYGMGVQAPIVEFVSNDVEFVGIASSKTKIRQIISPGEHVWVLGGESGSLIKGNFLAGKNYYVAIEASMGWAKARFFGEAIIPEVLATEKIQKQLKACDYVEISATGPQWFLGNKQSMFNKVSVGMEKWNDMDADERCYVEPNYGVDDIY